MKKKENPQKPNQKKAVPAKPAPNQKAKPALKKGGDAKFPVVGIGASAGGLEALETFFSNMPLDGGMGAGRISELEQELQATKQYL